MKHAGGKIVAGVTARRTLMATPIYKSFMGHMTEAWYALSADEQQALMSKLTEASEHVGKKSILMCDSTWSSDHYQFFGVEEFSDLEALQ